MRFIPPEQFLPEEDQSRLLSWAEPHEHPCHSGAVGLTRQRGKGARTKPRCPEGKLGDAPALFHPLQLEHITGAG